MSKTSSPKHTSATPRQKSWLARLRPALSHYFPHEQGYLDLRVSGPPQLHTNSRIYPFTLLVDGLARQELLVKAPHGRKAADVPQAWQAARYLHRIFAEETHLGVPQTLGMWEDPAALIMLKAAGEALHLRIKECRNWGIETGCQLAQNFVEQAGRWLALLHEHRPPIWAQAASEPRQKMETMLSRLRPFDIGPLAEKRIREQLGILSTMPAPEPVPLHGDYTLRNILCQLPQSIVVLDTELTTYGNPALDIGWFLAALHFIDKWQLFGNEMTYTTAVIRQTEEKFLHGYQTVRPLPPPEQIRAYTSLRLLERWAELAEHQQSRSLVGMRQLAIRLINHHFSRAILS